MSVSKWQSRRWWVCMWAMACATAITSDGIVTGDVPSGLGTALALLVGIAGGYIAADSMTKKKE